MAFNLPCQMRDCNFKTSPAVEFSRAMELLDRHMKYEHGKARSLSPEGSNDHTNTNTKCQKVNKNDLETKKEMGNVEGVLPVLRKILEVLESNPNLLHSITSSIHHMKNSEIHQCGRSYSDPGPRRQSYAANEKLKTVIQTETSLSPPTASPIEAGADDPLMKEIDDILSGN